MIGQFFSVELAAIIPIVILALLVFAIVALVTGRRDPDPAGSRPYAIYLVLVIFLSMFTALFALTAVASNVAKIPQNAQRFALPGYDVHKQQTAAAVEAALVALVAIAVMWFHVMRLRELVEDPDFDRSAGRRTYQVYLHAASFTAAAIFIFAAAASLYAIFRIAAPGYTDQFSSSGVERNAGVVQLVAAGLLALGAYAIFAYHRRRTHTLFGDGTPLAARRTPAPLPPGPPQPAPPAESAQTEVPEAGGQTQTPPPPPETPPPPPETPPPPPETPPPPPETPPTPGGPPDEAAPATPPAVPPG
jgi:hypothetical protein